ncbi:PilN domain-containing protein [Desulfonatronum sp. SC1]|uniref:PilN domain-containing protein n=1 Tax=Desulfonatronum sp. SC1 TaxID=2109626 RepID=UPI000D321EF9|nr:PilN domain-containing protein [Desulfonatronum sp. SC1]PTN35139.1 hypothetical protein C6366_11505 [Desulfonatronum sp. SC1]
MISTILSLFFPNTHALFLWHDKIAAYCTVPYFGLRKASAQKVEVASTQDNNPPSRAHIGTTLLPGSEDVWHLGLPLKYFILVNLHFPAAAADSLDQAVRFSLMRHVPFDLSQARVGYARHSGSGSGNGLDLEVSVIEESALQSLSTALGQVGIFPAGVFPSLVYIARVHGRDGVYVHGDNSMAEALLLEKGRVVFHVWDDMPVGGTIVDFLRSISPVLMNRPQPPEWIFAWECAMSSQDLLEGLGLQDGKVEEVVPEFSRALLEKAPYRIALERPGVAAKQRISLWLRVGLAVLFLLALTAYPFGGLFGKKAHLHKLEAEISRMKPQADIIAEKRSEIQDVSDFMKDVSKNAKLRPRVMELLHEMTQVLPGNAWLESFVFSQGRVRIQGRADSATSIIEAMENSPLFREVRFESPVTKSHNKDVFQISAEVVH